jgi:hypothetical protein
LLDDANGSRTAAGSGAIDAQALRMERMGEALWPTEKLSGSGGYPAPGPDAAVMGGERAGDGGVGADESTGRLKEARQNTDPSAIDIREPSGQQLPT